MKTAILTIVTMLLIGCGVDTAHYYTIQGEKGEQGQKGDQGDKGNVGETGTQGIQGTQGIPGLTGAQGSPGTNGSDATIGIVQLCASCHGVYPSIFPEIGMCINHKLYGVYSANGGFMVEITPGTYSSNGINCTCTLVVSANCVVH